MEVERGHLLIYKAVNGDSREKERVSHIINKKYKRLINKTIGKKKNY